MLDINNKKSLIKNGLTAKCGFARSAMYVDDLDRRYEVPWVTGFWAGDKIPLDMEAAAELLVMPDNIGVYQIAAEAGYPSIYINKMIGMADMLFYRHLGNLFRTRGDQEILEVTPKNISHAYHSRDLDALAAVLRAPLSNKVGHFHFTSLMPYADQELKAILLEKQREFTAVSLADFRPVACPEKIHNILDAANGKPKL